MSQSTEGLETVVKEIAVKAEAFLVEQGFEGFVTKENPYANSLSVPDIPGFIRDLQCEEILPEACSYGYVQYTMDNNESTYEEMATKFIVFEGNNIKGVIPFNQVIAEVDWNYQGLTESGFCLLTQAMLK